MKNLILCKLLFLVVFMACVSVNKNRSYNEALLRAIHEKNWEKVQELVNSGLDVNIVGYWGS